MTRRSPFVIELSAQDRAALEQRARAYTAPHHEVIRAKIVLLAAAGWENTVIAGRLDVAVQLVSKWRKRFYRGGPGRPGRSPADRSAAGFSPCGGGDESRRWPVSCPPSRGCRCRGGAPRSWPSRRSPAGWWSRSRRPRCAAGWPSDALKPWQHRSWIFPRDPDFAAKAARVLDLYAGIWDGEPLGDNEFVVCADEKTSIQARCRCHPTLPAGQGPDDAGRARVRAQGRAGVSGRLRRAPRPGDRPLEPTTGIEPFARLVDQVMTTEPYASADRVFWVVDNGSSHRGQASVDADERRPGRPPGWCTCRYTRPG